MGTVLESTALVAQGLFWAVHHQEVIPQALLTQLSLQWGELANALTPNSRLLLSGNCVSVLVYQGAQMRYHTAKQSTAISAWLCGSWSQDKGAEGSQNHGDVTRGEFA